MTKSKENKFVVCPTYQKNILQNGKCVRCGFEEKKPKKASDPEKPEASDS